MSDMKKKILEAFKRIQEMPEPKDQSPVDYDDLGWEYETLEEALLDYVDTTDLDESNNLKGDQLKKFEIGDIIMSKFYSPSSRSQVRAPHRIVVITAREEKNGVTKYQGFVMSSKVNKSNKHGGYPNTLYIKNYNSILNNTRYGASYDKEAMIVVNDLVKFDNYDFEPSGSYKGHVSDEFLRFIQQAYYNYKSGKDNSQMYWE